MDIFAPLSIFQDHIFPQKYSKNFPFFNNFPHWCDVEDSREAPLLNARMGPGVYKVSFFRPLWGEYQVYGEEFQVGNSGYLIGKGGFIEVINIHSSF